MKALARITLLGLCAATGVGLAWWASVHGESTESHAAAEALPPAVDGTDTSATSSAQCTNACGKHELSQQDCAACQKKQRETPEQSASLPWGSRPTQPRPFDNLVEGQLAATQTEAQRQSPVIQTQGYTSETSAAQQADSLLYTAPRTQDPSQNGGYQPPATSATGYGQYDNATPPALNSEYAPNSGSTYGMGYSQDFGPPQKPTLIVRMASAARPMGPQQDGVFPGEGDDKLEIYVNNRDIREVLTLLSEQGGINILPLEGATGPCSFAMNGVSVDEALDGILRSTGLIAHREGAFILVGKPGDFEAKRQPYDFIATRIYRPDYITSAELQTLLTPLITQNIGKIQATTPSAVGIGVDPDQAGGNSLADTDALLVQDYESVLTRIDKIVLEVDRRPLQVAIEAMILSVALKDEFDLGVDFQFLRNQGTIRFGIGTPETALSDVSFEDGGLRFAFLDSSMAAFIRTLEQIGDTDVIATPRLTVLNKQRAEILIGAQLGYVNTTVTETASTQSVDFLEIGTQLRLRPFIARDGSIRLEVHPELSTGNVRIEGGFTLPDKEVTSVTTNIMVQDGATLVIGGLMREDLVTSTQQVPYLGSLPWLGALFRSKSEKTEKREIVLLVTPRIVHEPEVCAEGEAVACEFHRRQANVAQQMSPFTRDSASRRHFENAQQAWARGDRSSALNQVHWALQFSPQNRAALDLQADILSNRNLGNHTIPPANPHGQQPSPIPPYARPHEHTEYIPPGIPQRDPGMNGPGSSLPDAGSPAPINPGFPAPGGTQSGQDTRSGARSASAPNYR